MNPFITGFKNVVGVFFCCIFVAYSMNYSSVVGEHPIGLKQCRKILCSVLLKAAVRRRSNNRVSLPLSLVTLSAVTASKPRLELLIRVTPVEASLKWNYYFFNRAGTEPQFYTALCELSYYIAVMVYVHLSIHREHGLTKWPNKYENGVKSHDVSNTNTRDLEPTCYPFIIIIIDVIKTPFEEKSFAKMVFFTNVYFFNNSSKYLSCIIHRKTTGVFSLQWSLLRADGVCQFGRVCIEWARAKSVWRGVDKGTQLDKKKIRPFPTLLPRCVCMHVYMHTWILRNEVKKKKKLPLHYCHQSPYAMRD